jgi:tetratricopeptide (TPR) repeat protein
LISSDPSEWSNEVRYRAIGGPSKQIALIVVSGILLLGLQSCMNISSEEKTTKHRERAQQYITNKQYKEALIELKNAAQHAPADAAVQYQIAKVSLQFDDPASIRDAYNALHRTVDLDPGNKDAQLKLGALYLLGQKTEEARACAEALLKANPNDAEGLSLRAHSYLREGKVAQGLGDLKIAIERNPSHVRAYIDLARAYAEMNRLPEAGRTLEQARTEAPNSLDVVLSLADFYFLSNQLAEAQRNYEQAIVLSPMNETVYAKLADFYQATYQWSAAERALLKVVSLKPDSVKHQLLLGELYVLTGNQDKAIEVFRHAVETDTTSLAARNRLVNGYLDSGHFDEAQDMISAILKRDKNDIDGRFFDGRLNLARGNLRQGHELLKGVTNEKPWFAPAHFYLGLAHGRSDDLTLARQEILESLNLDPKNLSARVALAIVHFREASYDLTVEQALIVLRVNPRHLQAAMILADAYLAKQDLGKSGMVLQEIVKVIPNDPQILYRLGVLSLARGHRDQAKSYFMSALAVEARFIEPLKKMAEIEISEGKTDLAIRRVSEHLQAVPNHSELHSYYGTVLTKAGQVDRAEAAYLKAISLDDHNLGAYVGLGNLYRERGRSDEAIVQYEAALAKDPRLNSTRLLLALIYEQKNDYDKAQSLYSEILTRSPRFAPAANNLAFLILRQGGNTDVALSYAQTAREGLPNDPYVADTIGWIYYHKNVFKRATSLLQEASDKLASNPMVQYHLGMALLKSGDKANARKRLEGSLVLDGRFSEAEKARAALAAI